MTNNKVQLLEQNHKFPPNGGALRDKKDHKDYNALELLAGVDVKVPTFQEGYSVRRKYYPNMKYKNQFATFSCTGQAWSLYKQVLQKIDTGEETELSAFSLYNPVAFPGVGAYIRDPGLRTVNYGVNKESTLPSPSTESEMTRKFDFTPYTKEAEFYKNRVTAFVNTKNFDEIARMIFINHGVVSGWNTHAVYFDEYGVLNGKRFLKTMNSYGEGNDLYLFESEKHKLFSIWTAIDLANINESSDSNLLFSDLKLGDTGRQVERLLNALSILGWRLTTQRTVYDLEVAELVSGFKLANNPYNYWQRMWERHYFKGREVNADDRSVINKLLKWNKS